MGFLSGVLGAVKDDEAVKAYRDFDEVTKFLSESIGKGYGVEGLQQAVGVVKEGLLWYEDRLNLLTGRVTSGLNKLSGKLNSRPSSSSGENYYQEVNEGHPLPAQLTAWKRTVRKIEDDINDIETNNIKLLDSKLHEQIMHKIGPVKKVVEHLSSVARNPEFETQVIKVEYEMNAKKTEVVSKIAQKSEELQRVLQRKFNDIDEKISDIDDKYKVDFQKLMAAVKQLQNVVTDTNTAAGELDEKYRRRIVQNVQGISGQARQLQTEEIADGLREVFSRVSTQLDILARKVPELQKAGQDVKNRLGKRISFLEGHLFEDIEQLKNELKTRMKAYITRYVDLVKMEVENIKDCVGESATNGKPDSIYKNWGELTNGIKEYINHEIIGQNGTEGLKGIQNGVTEYGNRFGTNTFYGSISDILQDTLNNNGVVKDWIGAYVRDNEGEHMNVDYKALDERGINEALNKKISSVIVDHIKKKIQSTETDALQKMIDAADGEKNKIEAYVTAVYACLRAFVQQLEQQITERALTTLAEEVAAAIDTKREGGITKQASSVNAKPFLTEALRLTLFAFHSKAKQMTSELNSLLHDLHIGNVDQAIANVSEINNRLDTSNPSGILTKTITNTLQKMSATITKLHRSLNEATSSNLEPSGEFKIEDSVDKRIYEQINTVDENLISLLGKAVNMIDIEVNSIIRGGLRGVQPAIRGEIKRLVLGSEDNNIYQALNTLKSQISALQSLVGVLQHEATNKTLNQVTSVKEQVGNILLGINDINRKISELDTSLRRAIEALQSTVRSARQILDNKLTSLKQELTQSAQEAFNAIYTEVKKMFADSHKADLKALKDLVDKQNRDIEGIISVDKVTGLKGLLWHMYGDNGRNIKMLEANEFKQICTKFKEYSTAIFDYITTQVRTSHPSDKEAKKVEQIKDAANTLLTYITNTQQRKFFFDDKSQTQLDKLEDLVSQLAPSLFSGYRHPELLDALKSGLGALTGQLDKAYVNRYVGGDGIEKWLTKDVDGELTGEGRKGASVLVTCLPGLLDSFTQLIRECRHGGCKTKAISMTEIDVSKKQVSNTLGVFLHDFGYRVSQSDKQEGELRNDTKCNGEFIVAKLGIVEVSASRKRLLLDIFDELISYFRTYYCVCHIQLPALPKYPSTIRDMLGWMCGLPYTGVFNNIDDHCQSSLANDALSKNDAVVRLILQRDLYSSLVVTCRTSQRVLVTICGNGNGAQGADYPYACAFLNNSQGFLYPSDVASLFDMLRDIGTRLLYQMYFVYSRCRTSAKCLGWRDCYYGQHIGGSSWECNTYQCPNQRCPQKTNQMGKQNGDQNCNQHPSCGVKSPLQSFLEDGLRGFLPHNVSSDGKSITCSTCPKTARGQPCITPMGFYDLATAGSITKRGITLYSILKTLCGNADAALPRLLRCLNVLCPVAPKCLADMFSLYCNVMQIWKSTAKKYEHDDVSQSNIEKAIESCFPFQNWLHNNYTANMITDKVKELYCSDKDHEDRVHYNDMNHRGLQSLSTKPTADITQKCYGKQILCGPYLHPLGHNAHHTYAGKNAKTYISCIVYLSEAFWKSLNQFAQAFQNISCKRYGCSSCNCISGKHGVSETDLSKPPKTPEQQCRCSSIVNCQGALSIFYQYGFTLRGPSELMEGPTKRLCDDFVKQMNRVLTSKYFRNLLSQCDEFLWAIRAPFIWLNVALWLLSFLYLLHIMIIRLDLLHIESHLHSPSSHRIAAQSLLAAGRVNKLNRVFYLQP